MTTSAVSEDPARGESVRGTPKGWEQQPKTNETGYTFHGRSRVGVLVFVP